MKKTANYIAIFLLLVLAACTSIIVVGKYNKVDEPEMNINGDVEADSANVEVFTNTKEVTNEGDTIK